LPVDRTAVLEELAIAGQRLYTLTLRSGVQILA